MKALKLIPAAFIGALIATSSVSATDFDKAYAESDAKRKEAASMGYEWRDTRKILKSATKANAAGDADKALSLVAKALEQSNDAIQQAQREADAWQSRVPK